jgi:peptidoglycan-associated lipoprotein
MTRLARFFAITTIALALAATACHKTPPQTAPTPPPPPPAAAPAPPPPPPPPPPPSTPAPTPLTEDQVFARKTLEQLNAEKPLSDVFFDYDKSEVTDAGRGALQKDADWFKRWSSVKVMIEGHCDSRGTPEYNLALGERRANAVKSYLVSLGIGADRLTIVSKGKEQPFCNEENESCWSQNRRGHFIITTK